jgi:dTMP kinase
MRGILITFEGIDGSGKSTQARMLFDWLVSTGKTVHLLREPGGTPLGEVIRAALLDRSNTGMTPESELFLYLAARAQLTATVIRPILERGEQVILDRFIDSTSAYQGFARGLGYERIAEMNRFATGGTEPDLTFLIDIDPARSLTRLKGEPDRLEAEGLSFMSRVREGYLDVARRETNRMVVVDGSRSIGEIHSLIVAELARRYPETD